MKRYCLYIGESGDHLVGQTDSPSNRYLCLLGEFIEDEVYRTSFHLQFEELKQNHFPHNPDEPIILHRKEIRGHTGPFWKLRDSAKESCFNTDLLQFLYKQDYRIIGVTIDKQAHSELYGAVASHPYHYCLSVLLERYCGFLNYYNACGDIIAESRGGNEDGKLKDSYLELLRSGTQGHKNTFFRNVLLSVS